MIIANGDASVGYSELFVKDFLQINDKIEAANAGLPIALKTLQHQTQAEVNKIAEQIEKLEEKIQASTKHPDCISMLTSLNMVEKQICELAKSVKSDLKERTKATKERLLECLDVKPPHSDGQTKPVNDKQTSTEPAEVFVTELREIKEKIDAGNDGLSIALQDLQRETQTEVKKIAGKIQRVEEKIQTLTKKPDYVDDMLTKMSILEKHLGEVKESIKDDISVILNEHTNECKERMLEFVKVQQPHSDEHTVSVNDTCRLIGKFAQPLADMAKEHMISTNLLQASLSNPSHNKDIKPADVQVFQTQVEGKAARLKVDDYVNREKMREANLNEQKEKLLEMKHENDQIRDCCVEIAAFLRQTSKKQGCDPYFEHLTKLVEEERIKAELGQSTFEMALEFVNVQTSYKKRVDFVINQIDSGQKSVLTTSRLKCMINNLAQMKYAGPTFTSLKDNLISPVY